MNRCGAAKRSYHWILLALGGLAFADAPAQTKASGPLPNTFPELLARAEKGDPEAACRVGTMYNAGLGVVQSYELAARWYRIAALLGNGAAQENLARCYREGIGVPREPSRAEYWEMKLAFEDLKTKAEGGDAESQVKLADAYEAGSGVNKSEVEAVRWYRKAAEHGLARAQLFLGRAYYRGEGVPRNRIEAYRWVSLAAAQGLGDAKNALDALEKELSAPEILNVQSLANSKPKALSIPRPSIQTNDATPAQVAFVFEKAEKGNAEAQRILGDCYRFGNGVTKDDVESAKWYRKAADQGIADAQRILGDYYDKGQGVTKDDAEAVKWYRKAADQGDGDAQCHLGICYHEGQGVTKDDVEAHAWFILSSAGGNETSKKFLNIFERSGTPDQIAEATKLAHELDAKIKKK